MAFHRGPQEAFDTIDTILGSDRCSSLTVMMTISSENQILLDNSFAEFLHGGSLVLISLSRARW